MERLGRVRGKQGWGRRKGREGRRKERGRKKEEENGRLNPRAKILAIGHHLPYGITQCYLPPDTSERTPP